VNVQESEIQRVAKLWGSTLEIVAIRQPIKGDYYQPEIFPDCPGRQPALESGQWLEGQTSKPKLASMDPSKNELGQNYHQ